MNQSESHLEVYKCTFQLHISQAHLNIRFPCKIFAAWKTPSNKMLAKTTNDNVSIKDNVALLDETIAGQVLLVYDKNSEKFTKKQTSLSVFLISKRKPDQQKLVGRVIIDLAEVITNRAFSTLQNHVLTFCSVKDGSLTFSITLKSKEKTDIKHSQIQTDSVSIISGPSKAFNLSTSSAQEDLFQFRREDRETSVFDHHKGQNVNKSGSNKEISGPEKGEAYTTQLQILLKQSQQERKKLSEQNEKLISIITKSNEDVEIIRQELNKAEQKLQLAQKNAEMLENEKSMLIEELLKQVKDETSEKNSIQEEMTNKISQLLYSIEKLKADLEESEQIRYENQSEMFQIKFQLSDLKTERQAMEKYLQQKDEELNKVKQEIQEYRKNVSHLSVQPSDLLSEKQRENYNDQIERLAKKVNKMQEELKFNEQTKEKMNEFNQAYNIIYNEKLKLEEHIQAIEKDRDRFEEAKRELEDKLMRPGQSQMMEELQTKILTIQDQTNRLKEQIANYENERHELENKIQELEAEINSLCENENKLNTILDEKDKHISSLQNALSQKEIELQTIEKYLRAKNQNVENSNQQITFLLSQKSKLGQSVIDLQGKLTKLETQLKNAEKEKEDEQLLNLRYVDQLHQLNKVRTEAVNRNLELENEMVTLQAKFNKIKSEVAAKQEIMKERKNWNMNLSSQMEEEMKKGYQYEERLIKLAEKEKKMRENILILEEQSKKIYEAIIEREENEEIQIQLLEQIKLQNKALEESLEKERLMSIGKEEEVRNLKRLLFETKKDKILEDAKNQSEPDPAESKKYERVLELNKNRIAELQDELDKTIMEFKNKIAEINADYKKLQVEKENLEKDKIVVLLKEKLQLKKQLNEEIEKNKLMEVKFLEVEEKVTNLKNLHENEIAHFKQKVEAEKSELIILQKQNKRLRNEINEYENKAIEQKTLINNYLVKIQDYESSKFEPSSVSAQSANSEALKRETYLAQLLKENQILKLNLNSTEATNKKLKMETDKLNKEVRHLRNESEESVKEISAHLEINFEKDRSVNKFEQKTIPKHQLVQICRQLKHVLKQRTQKQKSESMIELLIHKNSLLADNFSKLSEERGTIQETARKLSMQFQKIKSRIFKGKAEFTQRKLYLDSLKPCEGIVKELVCMSQNLSDLIQEEGENI